MLKNLLDADEEPDGPGPAGGPQSIFTGFDETAEPAEKNGEPYVLSETEPLSTAESVRQGGLAYSAGIVLFASVAFMLVIGWGADLLFGSSPWGIAIGIIVGALIGFFQFFRITSQIFRK